MQQYIYDIYLVCTIAMDLRKNILLYVYIVPFISAETFA